MKNLRGILLASAAFAAFPMNVSWAQDTDDVIVIEGIRGSLQRGLDTKQNADSIVDAISAEELGKFPDINVAESLQRITGVAISRTRGGEGQFVTVRGLGEEFNAVTYNGRLLATENNGREFSFDVIASELISAAEVYKSPTASQGDGSLGGRVNVRTAKPLDSFGFKAAGSLAAQYEELAEEWGPRASGVISNTNAAGNLGFIASFSYQDRSNRTDVAESTFLIPDAQVSAGGRVSQGLDGDNDGLDDVDGTSVTSNARFNGFAPSVAFQERERIGGTLAVQYQPNESTDIIVDALYTKFDSPGRLFGYSYFPSAFGGDPIGQNAVLNEFNQVVAADIGAFAVDLVSRETSGEAETFQIGANIEKIVNDRLTLNGDISYSKAEGNRDNFGSAAGSGTFFVIGFPVGAQFNFDASGGLSPDATFTATNIEADPTTAGTSIENLTADDVRLHFARRDTIDVEDEIFSLKGDGEYAFDDAQSIKFGFDYVNREKTNTAFNNVATQCFFCGYVTSVAANSPGLIADLFTTFNDGFLSDAPGNFPRVFPTFSVAALEQAYQDAEAANPGAASALNAVFDPSASSVVEETVLGAFFQFNLDGTLGGMPYDVNFGVRVAHTDLESTGVAQTAASITNSTLIRDAGATTTSNQEFTITPASAVTIDNDYVDVLPAVNFALDLTDEWKLRLGASRSLSRPTLTDLSTRFSVTSTNPGGEQITSANPLLEAIRSNNFDASVEWYGNGGTAFSAAVFYKDISDFVTSNVVTQNVTLAQNIRENDNSLTDNGTVTIPFLVAAPQNGDSAEIYGLELGGQYITESGFGVAGNVTITDSEATSGGVESQLENISDLSWNASAFYEANGFQARVSVNHRSDYLIGQTAEGGLNEFADEFTQVDLSAAYDINENFTVYFEGINVNDEEVVRISEFVQSNFLEAFEDNGARYVVGIRGSF